MISCAAVLLFELAEAGRALRVISFAAVLLFELAEAGRALRVISCAAVLLFELAEAGRALRVILVNLVLWPQNFPRPDTFRIQRYVLQLQIAQVSSKSDCWIASTGYFCITIPEIVL